MTPRLSHILITAGLVIGLLGAVVFGLDAIRKHKGEGAQTTANIESGVASAHQSQAQASDGKAAEIQAKLDEREKDLARLMAERDRLLRQRVVVQAGPVPQTPDTPLPVRDDRDDIIAADALVIAAQANFIEGQKAEISALVISRDEWRKTAEARERQALAQEAATEAWKKAVTTSKWRGRMEGFAAGVALGYVARGQR